MSTLQFVSFDEPRKGSSSVSVQQQEPTTPASPSPNQLDSMPIGFGTVYHGPLTELQSAHLHDTQGADDPRSWHSPWPEPPVSEHDEGVMREDVEASRPPSPVPIEAANVVQTFWNPPMNKWRTLAISFALLCNGANDSAPGALLPYMEAYYKIGYAIVSLVFITNAIGFIAAAFFINTLDRRLGRARVLMLCEAISIVSYTIMAVTPPFPVFVIAWVYLGQLLRRCAY